jgi:isoleucyl-tRNA synthetase
LVVLGTALHDQAPFQNCIVTGHIMAEDGRKMSKRLKNYPAPGKVLDEFGADALRAYLINSPVVRGDNLRFSEAAVREVVRTVLLPFWNAYSFFTTYAEADGISAVDLEGAPPVAERPEIDRWIVSVLQSLVRDVTREMSEYRLFAVIPPILGFIDDLTNWYIRRSRRRFWRSRAMGDADKLAAFATLYEVLVTFAAVAAPVLPFVTEELYQGLVRSIDQTAPDSVHHVDYPTADPAVIDPALESAMATVRSVVNLGHGLRKRHEVKVRQPLQELTVITRDPAVRTAVASHIDLIAEELNVKHVEVHGDEEDLVHLSAKADFKALGPRLGAQTRVVAAAIAGLTHDQVSSMVDGSRITVEGVDIGFDDIVVQREPREGVVVAAEGPVSCALDIEPTAELVAEGLAREMINRIQSIRRDQDLAVSDRIRVTWHTDDASIAEAVESFGELIAAEVLATSLSRGDSGGAGVAVDINAAEVWIEVAAD